MGRGYLEEGKWKEGMFPSTLKNDIIELNPLKLEPTHKYHLYACIVCPFASSASHARTLKNLEDRISISYVEAEFGDEGWAFSKQKPDPIHPEFKFLHQVFTKSKSDYTGRVSVPALYDITEGKLISIESLNCIELFNEVGSGVDLLKPAKDTSTSAEFEELKKKILSTINGGAYAAAFAPKQEDYEKHCNIYFDSLADFEKRLSTTKYIYGDQPTLLDIRLFVSLIRWIYVYYYLFKLNKKHIEEFPSLKRFVLNFYQNHNLQDQIDPLEFKIGYYKNMTTMNPNGVYPSGPDFDLNQSPSKLL